MPTDTQRAPTEAEMETMGETIRAALVRALDATAEVTDWPTERRENAETDARNALIIAIAKRVREAHERGMLGTDFPATPEAPHA